MSRGDLIYVMRPLMNMEGAYEHYGVDCGDGTVIHYYKGGEQPTIARTSFETFARGNPVFVKPVSVSYVPEIVVERAESRLGEQQYNLLTNNCEHFANWCKTGKSESQQLIDYGIGLGTIDPTDWRWGIEASAQDSNPIKAIELFAKAQDNANMARIRLQGQINRLQAEMNSWQRVAQEALKRGREDLARAALERKVKHQRELVPIQEQLRQLDEMQKTLTRNSEKIQQQIEINPEYIAQTP